MRTIRTIGSLIVLLLLIWYVGRAGFATLLSTYAARANQLDAADAAVFLCRHDADAHYVRGALLETRGDQSAAVQEYGYAVSLRPDDYVLWLSLARTREFSGPASNAISAAQKAVQLAPFYAEPHWQLGNILIRAGQRDRGFAELRIAASSNPTFLPTVVDLAWQLSNGDAQLVIDSIQPNSSAAYIAVADCFRKHERVGEAVTITISAGREADDYRRSFLDQLISAKRFPEAYKLWLATQAAGLREQSMVNPGFEQTTDLDEPGFGWRARKDALATLSLDLINPSEGKSSLEIEFKGKSGIGSPELSQLVIVEPGTHYQLQFSARSKEIVSGAMPSVTINDAVTGRQLGDSGAFAQSSSVWRTYSVDFTVPVGTSAIQIAVERKGCQNSSCPIFGHLWLDGFFLKRL